MVDKHDILYTQRCADLAAFVLAHGHSRIPVRIEGILNPIGDWCNRQRYLWRHGKLAPERIANLEAAGLRLVAMEPKEPKPPSRQRTREKNPTGPDKKEKGSTRRTIKRRARPERPITPPSVQKASGCIEPATCGEEESMTSPLNVLDATVIEDVVAATAQQDVLFAQRCAEIAAFVREHGHARIPVRITGKLNPLGNWCNRQRYVWRHGKLSPEKIAELKAAGLRLVVTEPKGPKPTLRRRTSGKKPAGTGKKKKRDARRTTKRCTPQEQPVMQAPVQKDCEHPAQTARLQRVAEFETADLRLVATEPQSLNPVPRCRAAGKDTAVVEQKTGVSAPRIRLRHEKPLIRLSIQGDRERLTQASRLVAESMRPPLIQSLLALPESVIRKLWQDYHKRQAPGGQLPMDAANILRRPQLAAHGAIYASVYLRYAGDMGFLSMNPTALIAGLDLYRQIVSDPLITGTIAWYIARDLRNRELLVYHRACPKCSAPYLTAPHGTHLLKCVFCENRNRRRKKVVSSAAHSNKVSVT